MECSQKYTAPRVMTRMIRKMTQPTKNTSVSPGAVMNPGKWPVAAGCIVTSVAMLFPLAAVNRDSLVRQGGLSDQPPKDFDGELSAVKISWKSFDCLCFAVTCCRPQAGQPSLNGLSRLPN